MQRLNTRLSAICFGTCRDETTKIIGIQLIVLRQRFWSAQANGAGISGGQSAAVRRRARILHSLFTRAVDSGFACCRWIIFRDDPGGAWNKITQQMSYFLDPSAVQIVQNIAQKASQPGKSTIATIIGTALALFGASGVFGQLQDALNTIWSVKAKPGGGIW